MMNDSTDRFWSDWSEDNKRLESRRFNTCSRNTLWDDTNSTQVRVDNDDSSASSVDLFSLAESASSCGSISEQQVKKATSFCCSASQKLNKVAISITPIGHIPYVHGGYAAVAPLFVDDPWWIDLLELLMPEAHCQVMNIIRIASSGEGGDATYIATLMRWAEHNPVVAAYGVLQGHPYRSVKSSTTACRTRIRTKETLTTAIEWDVFLDPYLVQKVDKAIDKATTSSSVTNMFILQMQVEKQVARLVSRMLLAHGSASQLIAEALGVVPNFNFKRLAAQTNSSTRSSTKLSSAIFVTTWLQLFLSALQYGKQQRQQAIIHSHNKETNGTTTKQQQNIHNLSYQEQEEGELFSYNLCGYLFCHPTSWEDSFVEKSSSSISSSSRNNTAKNNNEGQLTNLLKEIKEVLGGTNLRVVLDLKSRHVPPRVWARLIDALFSHGLVVQAIGSFNIKELRAIVQNSTVPVTPMIFFHSAGDLQRACHAKEIIRGDTVYFNGGSLLWQKPSVFEVATAQTTCLCGGVVTKQYLVDDELSTHFATLPFAHPRSSLDLLAPSVISSCIEEYKQYYDLNIGLYVQEFSIGQDALELLINFVNFHSCIYNLGIAYGGLNGATVSSLRGDGFWNQRYIGRNWDATCSGPTDYLPVSVEDNEIIHEAIVAGGAIGALYYEPADDNTHSGASAPCSTGQQNPFDNARFV